MVTASDDGYCYLRAVRPEYRDSVASYVLIEPSLPVIAQLSDDVLQERDVLEGLMMRYVKGKYHLSFDYDEGFSFYEVLQSVREHMKLSVLNGLASAVGASNTAVQRSGVVDNSESVSVVVVSDDVFQESGVVDRDEYATGVAVACSVCDYASLIEKTGAECTSYGSVTYHGMRSQYLCLGLHVLSQCTGVKLYERVVFGRLHKYYGADPGGGVYDCVAPVGAYPTCCALHPESSFGDHCDDCMAPSGARNLCFLPPEVRSQCQARDLRRKVEKQGAFVAVARPYHGPLSLNPRVLQVEADVARCFPLESKSATVYQVFGEISFVIVPAGCTVAIYPSGVRVHCQYSPIVLFGIDNLVWSVASAGDGACMVVRVGDRVSKHRWLHKYFNHDPADTFSRFWTKVDADVAFGPIPLIPDDAGEHHYRALDVARDQGSFQQLVDWKRFVVDNTPALLPMDKVYVNTVAFCRGSNNMFSNFPFGTEGYDFDDGDDGVDRAIVTRAGYIAAGIHGTACASVDQHVSVIPFGSRFSYSESHASLLSYGVGVLIPIGQVVAFSAHVSVVRMLVPDLQEPSRTVIFRGYDDYALDDGGPDYDPTDGWASSGDDDDIARPGIHFAFGYDDEY